MDPLSDVLSLLKPRSYASGGFTMSENMAIQWPRHPGIKCYAVVRGHCWLTVDGIPGAVLLETGHCYLLPPGPPFCLATDLSATPTDFLEVLAARKTQQPILEPTAGDCYLVGGHFVLSGGHADVLLGSLPPIVHIQKESDKSAMRWSLERMGEEVRDAQPGSSLITQQLAYMMLVQALRIHLADSSVKGVGWLFALADKQMRIAISCMHDGPGHPWTLQSLAERVGMSRSNFALRFKETVGNTPMEYLARWRMLLAGERLSNSRDSISEIALALGYESESSFGKAFKKSMGCSPRRYARGQLADIATVLPSNPSTSGNSQLVALRATV